MAQQEVFEKLNDYTLSTHIDFDHQKDADPCLRRIFNFAAREVTTIYSMWYSTGISTTMDVRGFSSLDSLAEAEKMRRELIKLGGRPPELENPDQLAGKNLRPSTLRP